MPCRANGLTHRQTHLISVASDPRKGPFPNGTVHTYKDWRRDGRPVISKQTTIHKLAPAAKTQQCDMGKLSKFQLCANVVWCVVAAASSSLHVLIHRENRSTGCWFFLRALNKTEEKMIIASSAFPDLEKTDILEGKRPAKLNFFTVCRCELPRVNYINAKQKYQRCQILSCFDAYVCNIWIINQYEFCKSAKRIQYVAAAVPKSQFFISELQSCKGGNWTHTKCCPQQSCIRKRDRGLMWTHLMTTVIKPWQGIWVTYKHCF